MPRMFGTDGVRGLANRDLTAQLALDLGDAAVRVLGDDERSEFESRRRALVGRDTNEDNKTPIMESAPAEWLDIC